jgi:hypothetical protein
MTLNPLFWLHLRLGSNRRNLVIVPAAFAVLVIGFASFSYYMVEPGDYGAVASVWLGILSAAQAAFLLVVGPSAIRRAVLTDFQTGMIESHRLSPMSSLKIIAGYLTGPPAQATILYATSLVFGTYFAGQYARSFSMAGMLGAAVGGWYVLQVSLLFVAFMVATLVLLGALATAGKTSFVAVVVVIGIFGGWAAVSFVPGLALLTGILSGGVLLEFIQSGRFTGDSAVIVLAPMVQFALGATFIRAACRKIRAPEKSLFSIPLSLTLLIIWGFTLVGGFARVPQNPWLFAEFRDLGFAQLICSTAAFLAVGLFALVAAASERFHLDRAVVLGAARSPPRQRALTLVPVLLGVLTLLAMSLMYQWVEPYQKAELVAAFHRAPILVAMLIALVLSYWLDYCLVYAAVARGKKILFVLIASVVVLKILPLAADAVIESILWEAAHETWAGQGYLTGLSPIGTLILCRTGGTPMWVGLLAQAVLAGIATGLAGRARRALASGAIDPHDSVAKGPEREANGHVVARP